MWHNLLWIKFLTKVLSMALEIMFFKVTHTHVHDLKCIHWHWNLTRRLDAYLIIKSIIWRCLFPLFMNFHYLVCDLWLSMYFVCLQVKHDEIQSKEVGMKMVPEVFLPRLLATKVRWRNKLKSRKCLKEIR